MVEAVVSIVAALVNRNVALPRLVCCGCCCIFLIVLLSSFFCFLDHTKRDMDVFRTSCVFIAKNENVQNLQPPLTPFGGRAFDW